MDEMRAGPASERGLRLAHYGALGPQGKALRRRSVSRTTESLIADGLLERDGEVVRITDAGRAVLAGTASSPCPGPPFRHVG